MVKNETVWGVHNAGLEKYAAPIIFLSFQSSSQVLSIFRMKEILKTSLVPHVK